MDFPRLQKRIVMVSECGCGRWCTNPSGGRELLDVNPVFQPANPAICNAWLIEDVEWNIGIIGHSPFAYSPKLPLTRTKIYDIFDIVIVTTAENLHRDRAVLAAEKGTMSL